MRQESQKQSKTLSTTLSRHSIYSIPVHSYHLYDSLLHFIVSFITDFKLHIIELKKLIYDLVDLDLAIFAHCDSYQYQQQCDHCQVQFMMSSCRKARNDIVRLISILRGFSKRQKSNQIHQHQSNLFLHKQKQESLLFDYGQSFTHQYSCKNISNPQQINGPAKQLNYRLTTDDIGFLTFRQIQARSKSSQNQECMRIVQENIETSRTCQENKDEDKIILKLNEDYADEKINQNIIQCQIKQNGTSEIFNKALKLINMIREEVNHQNTNDPLHFISANQTNSLLVQQTSNRMINAQLLPI